VSDTVLLALITGVLGIVSTSISAVVALLMARLNQKATALNEKAERAELKVEEAAVKVDEVKTTLETAKSTEAVARAGTDAKLDEGLKIAAATEKTVEAVHVLVNSSFSAQLKISALALRRIADLTQHADDMKGAEVAERLLGEHERKQTALDEKVAKAEAET
jgi:hypothetical protein